MQRQQWWREAEVWLLVLLTGAIYFTRLGDPPLTGEEPRRGQVAREMAEFDDWIVPRQQGAPFMSRPPVHNWMIALAGAARGSVDAVAIRLPSAVAMMFLVLLIYGYSRTFLSRVGALGAGAAFATMGLVLQFGWRGETEALYTLFVAGSLLLWRWADVRTLPPLWPWCAGYGLAALGMLAKGPQAPAYFVGGVGLYLVWTRRWREMLRWPHLAGCALFLLAWAAWFVPFLLRVGIAGAWQMLSFDIALRFHGANPLGFFQHLVVYPFDVAVCMLPWSILLLPYLRRDFRRRVAFARPEIRFLASGIGVALLSCWITPGAKNRYFLPLLPCVAPLVGLVVEQCCAAVAVTPWSNLWKRYLQGMALIMPAAAVWVLTATVLGLAAEFGTQPPLFAALFVVAAAVLGGLTFWSSGSRQPLHLRVGILGVATFLGLAWSGAVLNVLVATRQPMGTDIAAVKQRLPEGTRMVSLGPVDDRFLYYYGEPIRQLPAAAVAQEPPTDWSYFCMGPVTTPQPACDFAYETVGVVSNNAMRTEHPTEFILIGRRLSPPPRVGSGPELVAQKPAGTRVR
ncbi:MAG: glycosyltransferase family 39 protein [Thermoguttaceae bacterium]|jgi:4-amino-4-deoxy-L-arabinose transferase-like glycosyltransferase